MEALAGTGWSFACPDWKDRLREQRSLIPDLPLDRELASRAVRIFNKLRLPDVSGRPELRTAAGDWQRDQVAALFGSMDRNGRRRVRRLLNLIPKKNNKTTGAAAIMLTALLMDDEPRQLYSLLGATQKIAERGFDQAHGMILADPVLKQRFHIRSHLKTIVDQVTESTLKVQTFDEKVVTGDIPKGVLIDELHILGKVHYAKRVWGQIWGGMVARPGAFMVEITTQSDEAPAGVFKDELALARRIRDGLVTGPAANSLLPVLYEFPEEFQKDKEQPWRDPANWPMVLPNLGRSVHLDLLLEQYAEAQEKGAEEERRWASQHLNIQIGLGLHDERWRGADFWLEAAEPALTLADLLARSEVVTVGIDGGGLDDLLGFAAVGRETGTGRWLAWCHAFAVRSVLEVRKDIAPRLEGYERDGDLELVDQAQDMFLRVAALLCEIRDSGLLPELAAVGLDPADVGMLTDVLEAEGFDAGDAAAGRRGQLEAIPQGMGLLSAIHTAEMKLHDGMLRHAGSDMMAWCVGNAKAVQKGNAVVINKEVAGSAKIDPLIALFCAVKLMERSPEPAMTESHYAKAELLVI